MWAKTLSILYMKSVVANCYESNIEILQEKNSICCGKMMKGK